MKWGSQVNRRTNEIAQRVSKEIQKDAWGMPTQMGSGEESLAKKLRGIGQRCGITLVSSKAKESQE